MIVFISKPWKREIDVKRPTIHIVNPLVPTVAFSQLSSNMCCPRDSVSWHNWGTSGAPLKPLRNDSWIKPRCSLRREDNVFCKNFTIYLEASEMLVV